jgi:sarcosine oxidase gamma subunit
MRPATALAVRGVHSMDGITRFGMKGRDAAEVLQQLGVPIPSSANSITRWQSHAHFGTGRCLRLGSSEFLLEQDDQDSGLREELRAALTRDTRAAWFVHRADHSLVIDSPLCPDGLARICSFDFRRFLQEPGTVVMTLLADISVTLAREPEKHETADRLALRLWCDSGYADYLHDCLYSLAQTQAELTGETHEQG